MNVAKALFKPQLLTKRIVLMGPPGAGKTSVGRVLADRQNVPFIDMDDDVLQPAWGNSVASELKKVGNVNFIRREGETAMSLELPDEFVLSLSGSNPLFPPFMEKLKDTSLRLYLDIDTNDILSRLAQMKVDRIVSHIDGLSMREILEYRRAFYERTYDVRVLCESGACEMDVVKNVEKELEGLTDSKPGQLISTRSDPDSRDLKTFKEAVSTGLASNGGLFVTQDFPSFSMEQWNRMVPLSYEERALRILEQWIPHHQVQRSDLFRLITQSFSGISKYQPEVAPLVNIEGNVFVQELFHGPTASFKDLALQLTGRLLPFLSPKQQAIVVATSGDTGSAVLSGFSDTNWPILILYPRNGISHIQRLCMTQFHDDNQRFVCGVDADFDFCQTMVKEIFSSSKNIPTDGLPSLNGVNSINWGRLIPQIVYHCSAYLDLVKKNVLKPGEPMQVVIPSGNFGNCLSAFYAKQMGIPITKIIAASNENDILNEFLTTGSIDLRSRKLKLTPSPAIDILKPSNLERLIHYFSGESTFSRYKHLQESNVMNINDVTLASIRRHFASGFVGKEVYMPNIARTLNETGYLLDPHTAVASSVFRNLRTNGDINSEIPTVIAGTAHPAKFAEDVLEALDISPPTETLKVIEKLNSVDRKGPINHFGIDALKVSDESVPTWSASEVKSLLKTLLAKVTQ